MLYDINYKLTKKELYELKLGDNPLKGIQSVEHTLDNYFKFKDNYAIFNVSDENKKEIPICILSGDTRKGRCKLNYFFDSELSRDVYIFINEDKEDEYKDYSKYNIVKTPRELTLPDKRNFILDYCKENNIKEIFMVEDDVYDFWLPVIYYAKDKNINYSQRFTISTELCFNIFENVVKKNKYDYAGFITHLANRFNQMPSFINYYLPVQCVYLNLKKLDGLRYNNGTWEDYDFMLQAITQKKVFPVSIKISYVTPALKEHNSTQSNGLQSHLERCERLSKALYEKWGKDVIKLTKRKGFLNSKINYPLLLKRYKNDNQNTLF